MAYGVKYRLQFYDRFSNLIKVDILQDGYIGSLIELTKFGPDPVKINWFGEDKHSTIYGSECHIELVATTPSQYHEFWQATPREYWVKVYIGAQIYWQGYIDPDLYEEPFITEPYIVTIHASDCLGELKETPFPGIESDTYKYDVIHYITTCLREGGTTLPVYACCNITSDLPDRFFDDTQIDYRILRDEDGEWMNCYDIIHYILISIGCRIFQWKNVWWIERIDYKINDDINYAKYDYDGSWINNDDFTVTTSLTGNDGSPLCVFKEGATLTIDPPWKSITIKISNEERINILRFRNLDGKFRDSEFLNNNALKWWDTSYVHGQMSHATGTDYLTIIENFNYSSGIAAYGGIYNIHSQEYAEIDGGRMDDSPKSQCIAFKQTIRARGMSSLYGTVTNCWLATEIRVRCSNAQLDSNNYIIDGGGDLYFSYREETESWVQTGSFPTSYRYLIKLEDMGDWVTDEMETAQLKVDPSYTGKIYPVLYIHGLHSLYGTNVYHQIQQAKLQLLDEGEDHEREWVIDTYLKHKEANTVEVYFDNFNYPVKYKDNAEWFSRFEFMKGDGSYARLFYVDYPTVPIGLGLMDWLGIMYFNNHKQAMRRLRGELVSDAVTGYGMNKTIKYNSRYYIPNGCEWDVKNGFWNGEWIQLYDPDTVDTADYDADDFYSGDFWAM